MKTKVFITISILALIVSTFALPVETNAQTINQFEAEVAKYTKELEEKKNKIAKNDAEVAQIKKRISEIESQIKQTQEDIENLQKEIDKSNQEIEEKTEESKRIIAYYQVSNGENAYLEYAFGASDITDMIYRMSIVEQLTEYNDKIMKELEELIKKNEKQKIELNSKKESLNKLQNELQSEKERIDADTANIKAGMPGIEEQIKAAKAQIQSLKDMGCHNDETVNACIYRISQSQSHGGGSGDVFVSIPSTNGFYRPMEYGYLTQGYSGYGGHMGIDMSSSNKSIAVYPIANGLVTAKYYDNAGALVLKIRHNVGGSYIYSTYAHLRAWYVSIGQYVDSNTIIGLMGSTGNSSGPHLHLEVTTCDWKSAGGGCTWYQYQRSTINPARYVAFPSRWSNR